MGLMRKLLILCPFPPRLDAGHLGSRATAQLLLHLARRQRVALLALQGPGDPPTDPAVARLLEVLEEVPYPAFRQGFGGWWQRRAAEAAGLVQGHPGSAAARRSAAFTARLQQVIERWNPDIAQVEFQVMGQYLPVLRSRELPAVLVEHGSGSLAAREGAAASSGLPRVVAGVKARVWSRFECANAALASALVAFTDEEAALMRASAGGTPVVTIPPGVEIPPFPLSPTGTPPRTVLFAANYAHSANVDAARRLARDIFPLVRHYLPDARLRLAGASPPASLLGLAGPHVQVTGRPPCLEPLLEQAAVVAAPVRQGGSIRIEILEALAAGKALVATHQAVAGLGLRDGEHALLAGSDEDLTRALVRLLASPAERRSLAARARAWAETRAGWEPVVDAYEGLYDQLLGPPRGSLPRIRPGVPAKTARAGRRG